MKSLRFHTPQKQKLARSVACLLLAVSLHPSLLAATLQWQPLGDPGVGGRVTSIAVSPHNASLVLAGGDILAIARSNDGGGSWGPTFGLTGTQEIEEFTFHPGRASEVWVGTVNGPCKSTDAGVNWARKRTGFPAQEWGKYVAPVELVVVDADDANRLLAFTGNRRNEHGLYASTYLGQCFVSADDGETWTALSTIVSGANIYHAVYQTGSGSTLFVATSAGLYRSIDDGASWTQVTAGLPTGAISWVTVSKANANTLWVCSPTSGVYQSIDGGASFTARNGTSPNNLPTGSSQGWRNVEVSPANASVLYAATDSGTRGVWRSADGGANWTKGTVGSSPYPNYQDCSVLAVDPANAARAFTGTNTDIWRTTDGASWSNVTSRAVGSGWEGTGYSGQVPFEFKWNPWNVSEAMLCAMDSGKFLTRDNFTSWTFGGGGRGKGLPDWNGLVDVAFTNTSGATEVIYVTMNQNNDNRLLRTTNGGASWTTVAAPTTSGSYGSVVAHPTQTNRVWCTRNGNIYYSETSGDSWTEVGTNTGTASVLVADKDCTRFYAGGSKVFKSLDGSNFTDLGYPLDNVNRIKLAPDNVDQIYVVNRNGSNTYERGVRFYNGSAWSVIVADGASSIDNISEVAIDPSDPSRILVGTTMDPFTAPTYEQGVWMREGGVWKQQNLGLPAQRVLTLTFKPDGSGVVVAGISGRGYFTANVHEHAAAADTFARGGTYAAQNFGAETSLVAKDSSDASYDRQAYLKFNLSGLTSPVGLAELSVVVDATSGGSASYELYSVTDDTWTETGLNWNNRPAGVTLLDSKTIAATGEVRFNVTDFVNAQLSGDKTVSLQVRRGGSVATEALASFGSRESLNPPVIVIP